MVDKKRTDLPDGVFNGLPSPAGALVVLGASLVVPPGFESADSATTKTTQIESGGTSTCEFVIRRKPCVTGPVQAVISVDQREDAKEYL